MVNIDRFIKKQEHEMDKILDLAHRNHVRDDLLAARVLGPAPSTLPATRTQVAPEFLWRSHDGRMTAPRSLGTSHLFNIVSMIWNHTMPDDASTHNYQRYTFGPYHTQEYMERAIRVCLPEVLSRPDLDVRQRKRLEFMAGYLRARRPDMVAPELSSPQRRIEPT